MKPVKLRFQAWDDQAKRFVEMGMQLTNLSNSSNRKVAAELREFLSAYSISRYGYGHDVDIKVPLEARCEDLYVSKKRLFTISPGRAGGRIPLVMANPNAPRPLCEAYSLDSAGLLQVTFKSQTADYTIHLTREAW